MIRPFLYSAPLKQANASRGAVEPQLGTTGLYQFCTCPSGHISVLTLVTENATREFSKQQKNVIVQID